MFHLLDELGLVEWEFLYTIKEAQMVKYIATDLEFSFKFQKLDGMMSGVPLCHHSPADMYDI